MSTYNSSSIAMTNSLYGETNNFLRTLFITVGILITSACGSIFFVAKIVLKQVEKEYKMVYGYDSDNEEFFESNFLKEFDNLEEKDIENFDFIKDKYVIQKTPDGLVYMGLNSDNESFYYYCDYKNIKYQYLEVVARKFVIENNCKKLLINTRDEIIEAINNSKKKNDSEVIPSVFANLKNTEPNKKPSIDYNLKVKDKEIPIPEKCNKYIYKGKINDFEKLIEIKNSDKDQEKKEPEEDKKIDDEFENLDYNSYKKNK